MSPVGCGFNRSTQHLISKYREEDVEYEVQTEDLLLRCTEGIDVGQGVVARDGSNRVQKPGRVRVLLARDMGFAGRCTMLFAALSVCILFYQPQGALAPFSELGSLMYFALPPFLKSRLSTVKRYK